MDPRAPSRDLDVYTASPDTGTDSGSAQRQREEETRLSVPNKTERLFSPGGDGAKKRGHCLMRDLLWSDNVGVKTRT